MKSFTFAAAGLSLAYVASAVPLCAINCFQDVVTEHPPLDCTEPDMYHCFCKMTDLQQYFVECAYSDCPSTADGADAVGFGVELCAGLGLPITIDTEPPSEPTTAPPADPTSTATPPKTTDDDSEPEPTDSAEPTEPSAEPTESESSAEPTESESSAKPTETADESDDDNDDDTPTETGSTDEPSASGGPDGDDGEDSGAGGDDEIPVTAGAANAKMASGLFALAGVAAAVLV